jgi:hypothetical protein
MSLLKRCTLEVTDTLVESRMERAQACVLHGEPRVGKFLDLGVMQFCLVSLQAGAK